MMATAYLTLSRRLYTEWLALTEEGMTDREAIRAIARNEHVTVAYVVQAVRLGRRLA